MVGSYASRVFTKDEVLALGSNELDICLPDQVDAKIDALRPDVVVHLAAATNVDRCQTDPAYAFRVNEQGTRNISRACLRHNCTLVYASSGAVFDGRKLEPYLESDPVSPANTYGASKLAGEVVVRDLACRWFIARAG